MTTPKPPTWPRHRYIGPQIKLSVPADTLERLDELANSQACHRAAVVRDMIHLGLETLDRALAGEEEQKTHGPTTDELRAIVERRVLGATFTDSGDCTACGHVGGHASDCPHAPQSHAHHPPDPRTPPDTTEPVGEQGEALRGTVD